MYTSNPKSSSFGRVLVLLQSTTCSNHLSLSASDIKHVMINCYTILVAVKAHIHMYSALGLTPRALERPRRGKQKIKGLLRIPI